MSPSRSAPSRPPITLALVCRLAVPLAFGFAAVFAALLSVRAARADMAPVPAQAGTSLGSALATDIQMISETVLMSVEPLSPTANSPLSPTALVQARVVADFTLLNPSNSTEKLLVGFPLDVPGNSPGGAYIKLSNLRAFVAGQEADTQLQSVGSETWSAWQMGFAPGETNVRVMYDLPATVDACNTELGYVFHTGAAWAGPIGRADLIVRFPYAAEATFVSRQGIYLGPSTFGFRVEGTDLHWHYDNFEPTPADDLAVTFVTPECWLQVAAARAAVNQHATADNYWHLASAYADIVFPHHGFYSPIIAQVADAQFLKALALDPHNPQINASYAEFLFYQFGTNQLPDDQQSDLSQQCIKALTLLPNDDVLGGTCGYFFKAQIGDPNVSAGVQATAAAVLTAVAQPATPAAAANTASPVASPSPSIATSSTASGSPTSFATLTALPAPTATSTPIAVAQVNPAQLPTPVAAPASQQSTNSLSTDITFAVFVLALIAASAFYLRRQERR